MYRLTMVAYIDEVLLPYIIQTRRKVVFAMDLPAVALFNAFKGCRCDGVL